MHDALASRVGDVDANVDGESDSHVIIVVKKFGLWSKNISENDRTKYSTSVG